MRDVIQLAAGAIEVLAVVIIVIAIVHGSVRFLADLAGKSEFAYERYKSQLGKGLLLGLEFLVAADLVRTVVLEPTLQNVMILGLLVVIRTFLSWSLWWRLKGIGHGAAGRGWRERSSRRTGGMDELVSWLSNQIIGRVDGPLKFRLILQPAMAILLAFHDGLNDARLGSVPYFWAIFTESSRRVELIFDGWKAVPKVFIFAAVMDLAYQYLVLGRMYPIAALSIAFLLAFVPYLLIRGPVNRLAWAGQNVRKERRFNEQEAGNQQAVSRPDSLTTDTPIINKR